MTSVLHILCAVTAILAGSHATNESEDHLLPIDEIAKSLRSHDATSRLLNPIKSLAATDDHHAVVFLFSNAELFGWIGIGSLISERNVLCHAAGVLNFNHWTVVLDSQNPDLNVSSSSAVYHADYVPATRANDVGIIFLEQPLQLSASLNVIALPPLSVDLPMVHEQIEVTGFTGTHRNQLFSEYLELGFMRITELARCGAYFTGLDNETQFCAADDVRFSSLCLGDLGSGAMVHYRGQKVLVGIASMLTQNCDGGFPMVFTKVTAYRDWIYQLTGV